MIGPFILMQIYNPTRSIITESIVPRADFPIGTSDQGALAVMSTDRTTLKEYLCMCTPNQYAGPMSYMYMYIACGYLSLRGPPQVTIMYKTSKPRDFN